MVKIRLRRIGTKGRPFYRVVVAKSASGRNGAFVETLGQYDPVVKPTLVNINEERALYWLMQGAQPTETTAYLLNKVGILPKFFEQRPAAKKNFAFLDKRTASISAAGGGGVAVAEPAVDAPAPKIEHPAAKAEPAAPKVEDPKPPDVGPPVAEEPVVAIPAAEVPAVEVTASTEPTAEPIPEEIPAAEVKAETV